MSVDPRAEICLVGRRLHERGLISGTEGNLSVRLGPDRFLCTPTMACKGYLRPDDLCEVDSRGRRIAGIRERTSEIHLHLTIYRERPDVNAVVHTHPPHATAFAAARQPLPTGVLPEAELFLGFVPLAPYETPGTERFAETVAPFAREGNTILLSSHGAVSFAGELERACCLAETLEAYCRILFLARQLGGPCTFNDQQMRELRDARQRMGL